MSADDQDEGEVTEFALTSQIDKSKPFDEQLTDAIAGEGEDSAASVSSMMLLLTDRITDVSALKVLSFLWGAGRFAHKCGGSREKFLELAARAYDFSAEYDLAHPEEIDRSQN